MAASIASAWVPRFQQRPGDGTVPGPQRAGRNGVRKHFDKQIEEGLIGHGLQVSRRVWLLKYSTDVNK